MDHIQVALAELGVKEVPKGSNRGARVDVFTGGNAVPWCALFVSWCFRMAGKPLPGDYEPTPGKMSPLCSVSHMERVFNEHDWLVMSPEPGDVVFWKTRDGSDRGPGRHVSMIVEKLPNNVLRLIDGNFGDGVVTRTVSANDARIASYGRRP